MNKVSLPKKDGAAAAPVPKDPNFILIEVADIAKDASGNYTGFPARDANGVKIAGNIQLKAGATAIAVYCTPSTISREDKSEGDDDAVAWVATVVGHAPGDELAKAELLQNKVNADFIIITRECSDSTGTRLHGTPCNPMKLTVEGQDNNEAKKDILTFTQKMRSKFKTAHYYGTIPTLAADANYNSNASGSGASGA